jgi:hypothetical protein
MKNLSKTLLLVAVLFMGIMQANAQNEVDDPKNQVIINFDKEPENPDSPPPPPPFQVGLGESADLKLSVYPNPTNGQVTVEHAGLANSTTIRVYDLVGNQVYMKEVGLSDLRKTRINLSDLPSGVYMVAVQNKTIKLSIL